MCCSSWEGKHDQGIRQKLRGEIFMLIKGFLRLQGWESSSRRENICSQKCVDIATYLNTCVHLRTKCVIKASRVILIVSEVVGRPFS